MSTLHTPHWRCVITFYLLMSGDRGERRHHRVTQRLGRLLVDQLTFSSSSGISTMETETEVRMWMSDVVLILVLISGK